MAVTLIDSSIRAVLFVAASTAAFTTGPASTDEAEEAAAGVVSRWALAACGCPLEAEEQAEPKTATALMLMSVAERRMESPQVLARQTSPLL
jgi:hypothetical protein